MNNQKSILLFLFILGQFSLLGQTKVCFDRILGSAALPDFTFTYDVTTKNGSTISSIQPEKDGQCWVMTYPNIDMDDIDEVKINTAYDIAPLNGVSTFDMVIISKFIVGLSDLENCTNAEQITKILASDVNNSGTVSTFDLIQLRQIILQVITDFPNNKSWRFLNGNALEALNSDPDFDLSNLFSSYADHLDLTYPLQELFQDISIAAYKIGDVNSPCN